MKEGLDIMTIASRLQVSLDYVKEGMDIVTSTKKKTNLQLQVGHFEKILQDKKEYHSMLAGTEQALVFNVKGLWQMVRLLEDKKKYLEAYIEDLEKYIKKGSKMADVFIEGGVEPDSV